MLVFGYDCYQVVGYDIGMWIVYVLVSDQLQVVCQLVVIEVVIFGFVLEFGIFVVLVDNIFFWYFMFNQVVDLFEVFISGCECVYLEFMFDCWLYWCDVVVVDIYIVVYSCFGVLWVGFVWYCVILEIICQNKLCVQCWLLMLVFVIGVEYVIVDVLMLIL